MSRIRQASTCEDCRRGEDHCHDVLVVHLDEWTECADPACESVIERHVLWVACTEFVPGCTCG